MRLTTRMDPAAAGGCARVGRRSAARSQKRIITSTMRCNVIRAEQAANTIQRAAGDAVPAAAPAPPRGGGSAHTTTPPREEESTALPPPPPLRNTATETNTQARRHGRWAVRHRRLASQVLLLANRSPCNNTPKLQHCLPLWRSKRAPTQCKRISAPNTISRPVQSIDVSLAPNSPTTWGSWSGWCAPGCLPCCPGAAAPARRQPPPAQASA